MSLAGDKLIEENGETVTRYRLTVEVDDDYEELDPDLSTWSALELKLLRVNTLTQQFSRIISLAALQKGKAGWVFQDTLLAVFKSDADISAREGYNADVIEYNGDKFRVARIDKETILKYTRTKVFLEPLRGGQEG